MTIELYPLTLTMLASLMAYFLIVLRYVIGQREETMAPQVVIAEE